MEIERILCLFGALCCIGYSLKLFIAMFKERKEELSEQTEKLLKLKEELEADIPLGKTYLYSNLERNKNTERCLMFERKRQYSIFLRQNLTQAVNDLYFCINEPGFNFKDLIYILNKNGLYLVDVDTFDQSYDNWKD